MNIMKTKSEKEYDEILESLMKPSESTDQYANIKNSFSFFYPLKGGKKGAVIYDVWMHYRMVKGDIISRGLFARGTNVLGEIDGQDALDLKRYCDETIDLFEVRSVTAVDERTINVYLKQAVKKKWWQRKYF